MHAAFTRAWNRLLPGGVSRPASPSSVSPSRFKTPNALGAGLSVLGLMAVLCFFLAPEASAQIAFMQFQFAAGTANMRTNESAGTVSFEVQRTGNTATAVTVQWETRTPPDNATGRVYPIQPGSDYATPGSDYTASSGTLSFAANVNVQLINIPIANDGITEQNEDILIRLFNPLPVPSGTPLTGGLLLGGATELLTTFKIVEFNNSNGGEQPAGAVDRTWNADDDGTPGLSGLDDSTTPPHNLNPGANNTVNAVIQDGLRTVLVGDFTAVNTVGRNRIARLNNNGSLDNNFDPGTGANNFVSAVDLYTSGANINDFMIGGGFTAFNGVGRNRIARLNNNGSLDAGFNPGSGADAPIRAIKIDPNGRVVIGGEFTLYNGTARTRIARVLATGAIDTTFNPGAGANGTILAIAVQSDNKVIIGGDFTSVDGIARNRIARLNADGSVDSSFDPGSGMDNTVYAIKLDASSKALVAGAFTTVGGTGRNRMARLNTNGSLDTTFDPGTGASGANDLILAIDLDAGGQPYIGGFFTAYNGTRRWGVSRLYADGTVDTTFLDRAQNDYAGVQGAGVSTFVTSVAVKSSGAVIIGGSFSQVGGGFDRVSLPAAIRTRSNIAQLIGGTTTGPGTIEFISATYNVDENGGTATIYLNRRDGNIGPVTVSFATADGTALSALGPNNTINSALQDANGKVVVAGLFTAFDGITQNRIVRLNVDSSLDASFNAGGGADSTINAIALDQNLTGPPGNVGKIVVGGAFANFNTTARTKIGRLNADGSLDAGFNVTVVGGDVNAVYVEADGRVLLGGNFTTVNGQARNGIARVDANGTLDATFLNGLAGANNQVLTIGRDATGVLIGGLFTTANGTARNRIARLNPVSGALDATFDPGTGASGTVRALTVDASNRIVVAGDFTGNNFGVNVATKQLQLGIATLTTTQPHGFNPGDTVIIAGVDALINGTYAVATTPNANTFTVGRNVTITTKQLTTQTTATITTSVAHNFVAGVDTVTINTGDPVFDGTFPVLSTPLPTTFTYTIPVRQRAIQSSSLDSAGVFATTTAAHVFNAGNTINVTGTLNADFNQNGALVTAGVSGNTTLTYNKTVSFNVSQKEHFPNTGRLTALGHTFAAFDQVQISGVDNTFDSAVPVTITAVVAGNTFDYALDLSTSIINKLHGGGTATLTTSANHKYAVGETVQIAGVDNIFNGTYAITAITPNTFSYARAITANINNKTLTANVATLQTTAAHNLVAGAVVVVAGVDATFDGTYTITTVPTATTFTYNKTAANVVSVAATGTVTLQSFPSTLVSPSGTADVPNVPAVGAVGTAYKVVNPGPVTGTITLVTVPSTASGGTVSFASGTIFPAAAASGTANRANVRLARLNSVGTFDQTFYNNLGAAGVTPGSVRAIVMDGTSYLIGGDFTTVGVTARTRVARILSTGALDGAFNPSTLNANSSVNTVLRQSDGNVVVGGAFTTLKNRLARLSSAGVLESSYLLEDYGSAAGNRTWPLNDTLNQTLDILIDGDTGIRSFTVPIRNDLIAEGAETIQLQLTIVPSSFDLPTGSGTFINTEPALGRSVATLVIADNDFSYGTIGFAAAAPVVTEDVKNAVINVVRTGGSSGPVTVNYATAAGGAFPATPGIDYQNVSGTLTFASGETSKSFSIPVIDDILADGPKTVNLTLSTVTGGAALGLSAATLTINDNDPAGGAPSGQVDTSFDPGSGSDNPINAVAFESTPNGKVVIGGAFTIVNGVVRSRVARINTDGSIDATFDPGTGANNTVNAVAVQGDNMVVIGGQFTLFNGTALNRIARLDIDGTRDSGFNPGAGANGNIRVIKVQPDGKILLGGDFTLVDSVSRNRVARLNATGSLDAGFAPSTAANGNVNALALDGSGNVFVGGAFTTMNSTARNRLAKLDSSGGLVAAFNPPAALFANGEVRALALDANGDLLVGGSFVDVNGNTALDYIAKVDATTGALIPAYNPLVTGGPVDSIAVQTDGKVLIAGEFTSVNGKTRNYLDRLDSAGNSDTLINFGLGANGFITSVAAHPSQPRILIGGQFTQFDGVQRDHFAQVVGGDITVNTTGTLGFSSLTYSVSEDDGAATPNASTISITVKRTGGLVGAIDVNYADLDTPGGAVSGTDYQAVAGGTLTFAAGEAIKAFDVITIPNITVQPTARTVDLALTATVTPPSAVTAGKGAATLTIVDNDTEIGFSVDSFSVTEDTGTAVITVIRTGATNNAVSVNFATVAEVGAGKATVGVDYTAVSGTLNFTAGQTQKTFTIPITGDLIPDEGNETVLLQLSNPAGGAVFNPANLPIQATLTIVDDDFSGGQFNFSLANYDVNENAGSRTVTVTRSGGNAGAVSVQYQTVAAVGNGIATAVSDYLSVSGTFSWTDGDTSSRSFAVPIVEDNVIEGPEIISISLTLPTGGAVLGTQATATVTILDNDSLLRFNSAAYSVNENAGTVTTIVQVDRVGGPIGVVSVDVSTADLGLGAGFAQGGGVDYTTTTQTLTWTSGDAAPKFLTFTVIDDLIVEGNEALGLNLANPTGGAAITGVAPANGLPGPQDTATLSIVDDDNTVGFATGTPSVNEEAGPAQVTLKRVQGAVGQIKVGVWTTDGSAVAGSDYTPLVASQTITLVDDTTDRLTVPGHGLADGTAVIFTSTGTLPGGIAAGTCYLVAAGNPNSFALTLTDATPVNITDTGPVGTHSVTPLLVITWADADTADKTFPVTILDDLAIEGNETLNLNLAVISGAATVTGANPAVLTIVDNDLPGGLVDTSLAMGSGPNDNVNAVVIQPDQKILIGGKFTAFDVTPNVRRVARLGTGGTLDPGFANLAPGAGSDVNAVAFDPATSQIVIGGFFTAFNGGAINRIARLNANGTPDAAFNAVGIGANNIVYAVAIHPPTDPVVANRGKIVLGGLFTAVHGVAHNFLARLNADGSVEAIATFNPGTGPNGSVRALAIDSQGRILIGGNFTFYNGTRINRIARLDTGGNLDLSFDPGIGFGSGGADDVVLALAVEPGDNVLVGGQFATIGQPLVARNRLARLSSAGAVDATFNPDLNDFVNGLAVDRNSKVIAVGAFTTASGVAANRIVRLNPADGSIDPTVNFGSGANDVVSSVALQADGKLVIGGAFTTFNGAAQNHLARLHAGLNNDNGTLAFSLTDFRFNEAVGTATITVIRTNGLNGQVTVQYSATDGSAVSPADYTATSGTLTLEHGQSSTNFVVTLAADDATVENDKVANLTLFGPGGGAVVGGTGTATLTIRDNDSVLGYQTSQFFVSENQGSVVISVTRLGGTAGTVTVDFATVAETILGAATAGLDYTATSGPLTFNDGEVLKTFPITIQNDLLAEVNETISLILSNPAGVQASARIGLAAGELVSVGVSQGTTYGAATLTILDDEFSPGQLSFTTNSFNISESAGTIVLDVVRTGGSAGTVSVQFQTANGTALSGSDYAAQSGSLSFVDGQISKTITLTILSDAVVEGNETFTISLFNPGGGATLGTSTATINIMDDDGVVQFQQAIYTVSESGGSAVINIVKTPQASGGVTVKFSTSNGTATAGSDYTAVVSQTVSFAAADTLKTVTVPILEDAIAEGDETVNLTLSNLSGLGFFGPLTNAVLTITDNDTGFRFSSATYTSLESDPLATITVQRTGNTNGTVGVTFSTSNGSASSGSDYVATNGTLSFGPGETSKTFDVILNEDTLVEGNETVNLRLTLPTGGAILSAPNTAVLTIQDNDISFEFTEAAPTTTENGGPRTIIVRRNGITTVAGSVRVSTSNGTATAGSDYTAVNNLLLNFGVGVTTQTFPVPISNDALPEGDETLNLTLSNPTIAAPLGSATLGAQTPVVLTIVEDDIVLQFSSASYSVPEGRPNGSDGVADIQVFRLGRTNVAVNVTVNVTPGTAVAGTDYVPGSGLLTFVSGQTNATLQVQLTEDVVLEADETINLTLANPTGGAVLGNPSSAVLRIVDNDRVGGLDSTFDPGVGADGIIYGAAWQGSKIIIVGDFANVGGVARNRIARLNADGSVDLTFDAALAANNTVFAVAVDTNAASPHFNQVLIGGIFTTVTDTPNGAVGRNGVAWLNANGSVDTTTFTALGTGANGPVLALAIETGGQILVGGDFTSINGTLINRIARLAVDGTLDAGFAGNVGPGADATVSAIALQDDGSILIGGFFNQVSGVNRTRLARLIADGFIDGTLDFQFNPAMGAGSIVQALAVEPAVGLTQNILVGGAFTLVNGISRNNLVRLQNTNDGDGSNDGTIDLTFDPGTGPNSTVRSIVLDVNGQILIGGDFITVNATNRSGVARMSNTTRPSIPPIVDGTLDPDFVVLNPSSRHFDPGLGTDGTVFQVLAAVDGKVVAAGDFTTMNGVSRNGVARLTGDQGVIQFSSPTFSALENNGAVLVTDNGSLSLTVTRTGGSSGTVTVNYQTGNAISPNPASAGVDYVAVAAGSLTFLPGEASKTINITILQDNIVEPDEDFLVTLTGVTGAATLGAQSSATATILNDDSSLAFSTAAYTVAEGGGSRIVTVNRTGNVSGTTTTLFETRDNTATAGSDYTDADTPLAAPLTFDPTDLSKGITILITQDGVAEGDEIIDLVLSSPANTVGGFPAGVTYTLAAATLTIIDDDVRFDFSQPTYTITEDGIQQTITVTRFGDITSNVKVDYTTSDPAPGPNSASVGSDYTLASGILDFNVAGQVARTFNVLITDDSAAENNEVINLALTLRGLESAPDVATLGQGTATLTIVDNDAAFAFSGTPYSVVEGAGPMVVTVSRLGSPNSTVTVNLSTSDLAPGPNSATNGLDYTTVNTPIVFGPGVASQTVSIPIVSDGLAENDEGFTVGLSGGSVPAGGTVTLGASAVVTIVDDDALFSFSLAADTVTEDAGPKVITVTRAGSPSATVSVNFATSDFAPGPNSATAGLDYTANFGPLSFGPAVFSQTFNVAITDDGIDENNERLRLSLFGGSTPLGGTVLIGTATETLTILDNDARFSFSASAYSVNESAGSVLITVTRSGSTNAPAVLVDVYTSDLAPGPTAATANSDYTEIPVGTPQTLTFPQAGLPGAFSQSFPVFINNDGIAEQNEDLRLNLTPNPAGVPTGGQTLLNGPSIATATLTIQDNDVQFSFDSATYSVGEAAGFKTITIVRSGDTTVAASVDLVTSNGTATKPADYVDASRTVSFIAGQITSTVNVVIVNDTLAEGDETVNLTLQNAVNGGGGAANLGVSAAVLTIVDNDVQFSFAVAAQTVSETGGPVTITVTRIGDTNAPVSVNFATSDGTATGGAAPGAGVDYLSTSGTLNFAATVLSQTFQVNIQDDLTAEGDELLNLTLSAPVNATGSATLGTGSATLTIQDNDVRFSFSQAGYSVVEAAGPGRVLVNRTGDTNAAVSVVFTTTTGGTATATAADYLDASRTLQFVAGQLSTNISITILDDPFAEGNETVNLGLSAPVNLTGGASLGLSAAVLTIVDDDFVTLVADGSVVAAGAESFLPGNNAPDPYETVTMNFAIKNTGNRPTANLTAELLTSGGVLPTAGAETQTYGVVGANGGRVEQPFQFLVNSNDTITATFKLLDGTTNLGNISFKIPLGAPTSFTNRARINIPGTLTVPSSGVASNYPSVITTSNLVGVVQTVTLRLEKLQHTWPDDLDILLVSPDGQKSIVLSDVGGGNPITDVTLVIDDTAASSLPDAGQIVSGTFKPTNFEVPDAFPAPAPSAPYATNFTTFRGSNPNGDWSLFIVDDLGGNSGVLKEGWSLTIATIIPAVDLALTVTDLPDPVALGNNLTYLLVVTNLGPATATGVVLTNTLPSGVNFVLATNSQGSFDRLGNVVQFNVGTLASGAAATNAITVTPGAGGTITNVARAALAGADRDGSNNVATNYTSVTGGAILIAPATAPLAGGFSLTIGGVVNKGYVIEVSSDLVNWTPVATNWVSGSSSIQFMDTNAPNFNQRFYRAIEKP